MWLRPDYFYISLVFLLILLTHITPLHLQGHVLLSDSIIAEGFCN